MRLTTANSRLAGVKPGATVPLDGEVLAGGALAVAGGAVDAPLLVVSIIGLLLRGEKWGGVLSRIRKLQGRCLSQIALKSKGRSTGSLEIRGRMTFRTSGGRTVPLAPGLL